MTSAPMAHKSAADLVAAQAEDVFEEIEGISGDILIIDTPGQVELFAFREASNHLVQVLGRGMACLVFLFDPMLSQTPVDSYLRCFSHLLCISDLVCQQRISYQNLTCLNPRS